MLGSIEEIKCKVVKIMKSFIRLKLFVKVEKWKNISLGFVLECSNPDKYRGYCGLKLE